MSVRDNARERARLERINALASEIDAQGFGKTIDSRVTVINYDSDKGVYLVKSLDGKVSQATNISGTQLGVGATVQATKKGNGYVIDYFDQSSGKGVATSGTDDLSKDVINNGSGSSNTFNPPGSGGIPGFNPGTMDGGFTPNGKGGCDFGIWPKGERPADVYANGEDCLADQAPGDWVCENGKCVKAPPGQGKYVYKRECEAKVKRPNFKGGQCSILYKINIRLSNILNPYTGQPTQAESGDRFVLGPLSLENRYEKISGSGPNGSDTWSGGVLLTSKNNLGGDVTTSFFTNYYAFGQPSESMEVEPADSNQQDNCGDPPGQCGTD